MQVRRLKSNKALLCAVSIKSSGYDLIEGEMKSITLLPLDENLRPYPDIPLFKMVLCTESGKFNGVHLDRYLIKVKQSLEVFKGWYRNIDTEYRICLLGWGMQTIIEYVVNWLGGKREYLKYFTAQPRDLQQFLFFKRDRLAYEGEVLGNIHSLNTYASSMGISTQFSHYPERECLLLAEVYRRSLQLRK